MKRLTLIALVALISFSSSLPLFSQEANPVLPKPKVQFELAVDLLSRMLWHGYQVGTNPAITPLAFLYYRNFTLELNGTYVGPNDYAESNINFSYQYKGFRASLLNYIVFDSDSVKGRIFGGKRGPGMPHVGDLDLTYTHPTIPIFLHGSMLVWGNDYKPGTEENRYSTYFEAGYDFKVRGASILPYVAATPWKSCYADHACVTNIGVRASYPIKFTDKFSLPIRFEMTYNTFDDAMYVNAVARLTTGIF